MPGIEALTGAGVYYGAPITEAVHCKGQDVFVVGGANSAGQAAMLLSRYASKVKLLVRQGAIPRVAAAVGQGGMVVSFVHEYLKTV